MHALLTRVARPFVAAVTVALVGSALVVGPGSAAGSVSVSTVLSGYSRPVLVTAPRGSNRRIYIVEQTGKIRMAKWNGSAYEKAGTFLDVRDRVLYNGSEQGLLGLAFAPDYATSGKLYIDYTRKSDGATVVAETGHLSHDKYQACRSCLRTVIRIPQPYANHNGGDIHFGPDGLLYIGMGDGGSGDDPGDRAQDLGSRLGKILRINPRDPDGSGPRHYSVPGSNPFVGDAGAKPEIWAYGFRNPWRWSFDRLTGDLVIGDVGQGLWEEIDFAPADSNGRNAGKGLNFGWDVCEGTHDHEPAGKDCTTFGEQPIREYDHNGGRCAVTGGYVYRGPDYAPWQGIYTYADYCSGQLWAVTSGGQKVDSVSTGRNISGFGEDGAGRLFATDLNGRILKVRFSGAP
jgi:glucose/arabinose dehydrogenase